MAPLAGTAPQVSERSGVLGRLRAEMVDLGPLRWVAFATAVLPTAGLFAVWSLLPQLTAAWPAGPSGVAAAALAIGALVASLALPAAFSAFAAGYLLGPVGGAAATVVGLPVAGWLGQHLVWPLLAARLYPILRPRPRVAAVAWLARERGWRGVAAVRAAAVFPFQVTSLMLSGAAVPARRAFAGAIVAAVPVGVLGGVVGHVARCVRETGRWPPWPLLTLGALAAVLVLLARRRGRRAWLSTRRQVDLAAAARPAATAS